METETKKRRVRNPEYLVLMRMLTRLEGDNSPDLNVCASGDEFSSSEEAEAWILEHGIEAADYFVVRMQKGPMRLKSVKKLS